MEKVYSFSVELGFFCFYWKRLLRDYHEFAVKSGYDIEKTEVSGPFLSKTFFFKSTKRYDIETFNLFLKKMLEEQT